MRTFSLDMIPGGAQTAVACNQYESGDTWVFALYYDGGRYIIPADATVSITGTKPDGAAYNIAGTVTDNTVVITVTDQITACAGRSIAEILVESETDGTTLYSANFPLLIEPAAVQGEFSPSVIPTAIVDTEGNVYYSAEYIPEVSGGVPTEVRQAMKTLFSKAAYIEEGLADEVAVITAWAEATTAITVSPSTASVSSASPTAQLSAVTTPAGGAVTWASSNTAVATVSSTGLVTAVGNGTCTITATSGTVSASCAVTVTGFRTLTGIEAVYTQSGTVYDTASLDDLKDDLVVTGTYDDSTTETITDYTLSGTLAEGTSTITVSYGGFTDTFTVTVTAPHEEGLLYSWDFTTSLVDTVSGKTATLGGGATRTSAGLVFTGNLDNVLCGTDVIARNRTLEIDFGTMDQKFNYSSVNGIFFWFNQTPNHGFGWTASKNAFGGFWNTAWNTLTGISDLNYFSGSTFKMTIDSNGYPTYYKDGEKIGNSVSNIHAVQTADTALLLGSTTSNYPAFYDMVIEGIRIYEGVV